MMQRDAGPVLAARDPWEGPRNQGLRLGTFKTRGEKMLLILLIIVLLLSIGTVPAWPYSRGWGYYPSGGLGVIVVILLILMLMRF